MFNKSANNFNADVAMAGNITVAEVEKIVDVGKIPPE